MTKDVERMFGISHRSLAMHIPRLKIPSICKILLTLIVTKAMFPIVKSRDHVCVTWKHDPDDNVDEIDSKIVYRNYEMCCE